MKSYSTDPKEALLLFEVQTVVEQFRQIMVNFYVERKKEKPDDIEHQRDTMNIILNGILSTLGSHLISMRDMGADMKKENVEEMIHGLVQAMEAHEKESCN